MINKIRFKNFKLFKNWESLELKPITILIGKNNSGKSAITKLPTMLSGSLSGDFYGPIKPENNDIKLGLSYEDLVYNRYAADTLEFEIFSDVEQLSVALFGDRNNKIHFAQYTYNSKNIDLLNTRFRGFTMEGKSFETLKINYDYIGPFRELPIPYYNNSIYEIDKIGIRGEKAYPLLIQNNGNKMFNEVSEWYKANFEGWGLKVSQISGHVQSYEIALDNNRMNPINLVNVGQGIHQVLPLIVRSYLPAEDKTLIIIEEPETHLHPAAHGNLAERFVESFLIDGNKNYLLETHSQNFILRLRRLVAQKKLKKEDLAIYYVDFDKNKHESSLKLIPVDDEGEVEWWPSGIFNESLEEAIQIRKAQQPT